MAPVAPAPLVRLKGKSQITIPAPLLRQFELSEGDFLEATSTEDGILLTPKSVVDRSIIAELKQSLRELQKGHVLGPFKNAKGLNRALKKARAPKA